MAASKSEQFALVFGRLESAEQLLRLAADAVRCCPDVEFVDDDFREIPGEISEMAARLHEIHSQLYFTMSAPESVARLESPDFDQRICPAVE